MKKTLLEHHYELRIESLKDDPNVNYGKRLVIIEMLANEFSWKHMIEREAIEAKAVNIYNA